MYGCSAAGVYMKNLIRRLFGRFYIVTYSDVLSYKGSWRKGAFHGYGVLEYSNGAIYKGNFKYGVKHGFGLYTSASGFRYEGNGLTANKQDQQRFRIRMATGMKAQ